MAKRKGTGKKTTSVGASPSNGVNKAELIRQTARSMGGTIRPRDIIAALKVKGVVVSSPQVSKTLKAAGFHRKRSGKKGVVAAGSNGAVGSNAVGSRAAGSSVVGSDKLNKAERIREIARSIGKKVRPRDIIAALHLEGVRVASAQVSETLRRMGYRRRHRRSKGVVAAANSSRHSATNGLNLEALLAAKALILKAGSVEVAEEAIRAIKKLG